MTLIGNNRAEINGTIDLEDWAKLRFCYGSKCHCCGAAIDEVENIDSLCGNCLMEQPFFDTARAALFYDDNSKKMILDLKHGGRKDGVRTFAKMMRDAAFEVENTDIVLPVPICRKRLFMRGFNQSVWLGQEVAKLINRPFSPFILKRHRDTKTQNGLSHIGRINNVKGAFSLYDNPDAKKLLEGKNVLLIDDVFTTGATVNSCAKALKKHGAKRVDVLTFMRVNANEFTPAFSASYIDDAILGNKNDEV